MLSCNADAVGRKLVARADDAVMWSGERSEVGFSGRIWAEH